MGLVDLSVGSGAFGNSMLGMLAIVAGMTGLVAQWFGITVMVLVIGSLMLIGISICQRLPEAEAMLD